MALPYAGVSDVVWWAVHAAESHVRARVAEALAPIARIPDEEPLNWTAEQWRANASYWYAQAQEAYRYRDLAAAEADRLRAALPAPEPTPTTTPTGATP